jgi:hypothetical protein
MVEDRTCGWSFVAMHFSAIRYEAVIPDERTECFDLRLLGSGRGASVAVAAAMGDCPYGHLNCWGNVMFIDLGPRSQEFWGSKPAWRRCHSVRIAFVPSLLKIQQEICPTFSERENSLIKRRNAGKERSDLDPDQRLPGLGVKRKSREANSETPNPK